MSRSPGSDSVRLARVRPADVCSLRREPFDTGTLEVARRIVEDVRLDGEEALRDHCEQFNDIEPGAPLVLDREQLERAFDSLVPEDRALLQRTAQRIRTFAERQRETLADLEVEVPGGTAGHRAVPVGAAGCYAPGGRHPLPSSVLMTAVTARTAGVADVTVASPRPTAVTLAAAHIAGADRALAAGGAHAVAALAFGVSVPTCDLVVGPGNRFVTAAKHVVSAFVGIDLLAGPSELVAVASGDADAAIVAADLLAQAEHDDDALPVLITDDEAFVKRVETELEQQLGELPTETTARAALRNGFAVVLGDLAEAPALVDRLAPEHLQLHGEADRIANRFFNYGALFRGSAGAEVLGDYGAGPNHVLPTGGGARSTSGLSVFSFLRFPTFLDLNDRVDAAELLRDAAALARLEGLAGHAAAASRRLTAWSDRGPSLL